MPSGLPSQDFCLQQRADPTQGYSPGALRFQLCVCILFSCGLHFPNVFSSIHRYQCSPKAVCKLVIWRFLYVAWDHRVTQTEVICDGPTVHRASDEPDQPPGHSARQVLPPPLPQQADATAVGYEAKSPPCCLDWTQNSLPKKGSAQFSCCSEIKHLVFTRDSCPSRRSRV